MSNIEFEKCRNDIVYFIERYLGHKLTTWQKMALKLYQTKGGQLYLVGQRYGKRILYQDITEHKKLLMRVEKWR